MEVTKLKAEVAYATPACQHLIKVLIPMGCTVECVILASGILDICPEINLMQQKVGIFSKPCQLQDLVKEGDRIEIYRPLIIDPKEARRKKSKKMPNRPK